MIRDFIKDAPVGTARTLQVLAVAESLTDPVAEELYGIAPIVGISGQSFLDALRQASFIQPRNSEWSIERSARDALLESSDQDDEALVRAHQLLLRYTENPDAALAGDVVPNYLYTLGGRAYHQAGAGQVDKAIGNYGEAAVDHYNGAQWLAAQLADFQERLGVLPNDRWELLFLRAITLFREGKRDQARPLIERVVKIGKESRQTAMALNILGNMVSRTDPLRAEALFRSGIDMDSRFENAHGVAIGQHNLGRLIGRDRRRFEEARSLLTDSIRYGEINGKLQHTAQARHSYGYLLNQFRYKAEGNEAERQLRQAIEELAAAHDLSGAGQVMHTLALLVVRDPDRGAEAEALFRRSIEIGERTGDQVGVAMRTFTLGKELSGRLARPDDGFVTLQRAREMMLALRKMKEVRLIDERIAELKRHRH